MKDYPIFKELVLPHTVSPSGSIQVENAIYATQYLSGRKEKENEPLNNNEYSFFQSDWAIQAT